MTLHRRSRSASLLRFFGFLSALASGLFSVGGAPLSAIDLPAGFEAVDVVDGLADPSGLRFAPDGRLFIAERIEGTLRVATLDAATGDWNLSPTPFYSFDIPEDAQGNPERHRSSGLRDFIFDPDFASNGYLYALYMRDNPRHNRVVRITADSANPAVALAGSELLLLDLPFNGSVSSGSHNGGGIAIGTDGHLYVATGDGWNGGDLVQSLSTFTGKICRIALDGSIPTDNPFYNQASGDARAIYALGLRNPFSMSRHPVTGQLFVNECNGPSKANIFAVTAGANYGHQGYGGIGTSVTPWGNGAVSGEKLITGGAWYPAGGSFGAAYAGRYFVTLWGGNNDSVGALTMLESVTDATSSLFASAVGEGDCASGENLKPVTVRVGPAGDLYCLLTSYEAECGKVVKVGPALVEVAAPSSAPAGGWFPGPVTVTLSTATVAAEVRFTIDGSEPTATSSLYSAPLSIAVSTPLRARAFLPQASPSAVVDANFVIAEPLASVTPTGPLSAGLRYRLFAGSFLELPPFAELTPAAIGTASNLSLAPSPVGDDFALLFDGLLTVPTSGGYTFFVTADDAARLRIDGLPIVDATSGAASGPVELLAGSHAIALEYYQSRGASELSVSYDGPGVPLQAIPDSALTRPQNLPPSCDATAVANAALFDLVELNGSASSDPDSDELLLTWYWEQLSGPPAALLGDDDAVTWFVAQSPGDYVFQLTVGDGESTDSDTVQVSVAPGVVDVDAGLLAHWRLDDGSGGTATDTVGVHDGTLVNGPLWGSGSAGGALAFDGVDDRVDIDAFDIPGAALTIAFWFRADDFEQMDGRFISKATGVQEAEHYWMVSTITDTALRFRLRTAGVTTTLASAVGVIQSALWTHVVARYDGVSMQIHRDGQLVAEAAKSGSIDASAAPIALGDQPQGARAFDGLLDDIRVYGRALTAPEIALLASPGVLFRRGDVNGDGGANISDVVALLSHLFAGGNTPGCLDSGDVDDNGALALADGVLLLAYLFSGAAAPAPPFPDCGSDPTPVEPLDCVTSGACP